MNCLVAARNCWDAYIGRRVGLMLPILLTCCALSAPAQNITQPRVASTEFSIRATHLLGFENAKSNCNGTLSIQDDALQFQHGGKPGAQVKIATVRGCFSGRREQAGRRIADEIGQGCGPVRRRPRR